MAKAKVAKKAVAAGKSLDLSNSDLIKDKLELSLF